jgi:uncharacterized protein (DUF433 family)
MDKIKLHKIITIEAGKRSDKPCIRGLRITTYDIMDWLQAGMTVEQIISDFPELNKRDIQSCIEFMKTFRTHRSQTATSQILAVA